MYEPFYGFRERPFSLSPDPRFLFMTPRHREALSNLTYGVSSAKAITLLIGEAGTGKTTLVRTALSRAGSDTDYVVVSNPTLTRSEFVRFLASAFGLSAHAAASKGAWLVELERLLRERHRNGITTALLVDEAQSLPDELLEEVRLLSNIETDTEKLLPIVLIGQPELATRLNSPSLRQLKQRVALRCELAPFDLQGTATYIANRLQVAGGTASSVFTRDAVIMIHEASRGIPRTINVLCDNALLSGFALGERPIGRRIVGDVCNDFAVNVDAPAAAVDTVPGQEQLDSDSQQSTGEEATVAHPPAGDLSVVQDTRDIFAPATPRRRLSFLWVKR